MLPTIKYVIPSYNRIDSLKTKTLALLEQYDIPKEQVYIFTAPSEFESYQKACPDYNVVCGELGLKNQRNYITNFFPEGAPLVSLDDDIEKLYTFKRDQPRIRANLVPIEDLKSLVEGAFLVTKVHNLNFWGISPSDNNLFLKEGYSTNLKFCIGHMWGCYNCKEIVLTLDYKEDYERTLKFYQRDGGVLRMNWVCAKTKMYQAGGIGLKQKQRLEHNMKSARDLVDLFPGLVKLNQRKEGEIMLSKLPQISPVKTDEYTTPRTKRRANQTLKQPRSRTPKVESTRNNN